MSKKPQKKSDMLKPWMQSRRDNKIPILPEYHLIISEGTKTEPNYFEGLKHEINYKRKGRIDIRIEGEGDNTLSLLKRAQAHVKKSNNNIKHVWLVYDLDDFPRDDFDNTAHKCSDLSQSDGSITYHALWSNQSIELWFLLHFAYHQEDTHRAMYKPALDRNFKAIDSGAYEKNRSDTYTVLRPYLSTAIDNAKKLKEFHDNPVPSKNAPGTNVFEIFDLLSAYLEKDE